MVGDKRPCQAPEDIYDPTARVNLQPLSNYTLVVVVGRRFQRDAEGLSTQFLILRFLVEPKPFSTMSMVQFALTPRYSGVGEREAMPRYQCREENRAGKVFTEPLPWWASEHGSRDAGASAGY